MVRSLLKKKGWTIIMVLVFILGSVYLAEISNQKVQVQNEWNYWMEVYKADQKRYESLIQSNSSQEGKNREREEEIRGIWNLVSNWGTTTYEDAKSLGASSEFAKYALAEKLDNLALELLCTSSDKSKIQKCQAFIQDVTETIGKEGFGNQAVEYANYLIRVFKDRK